MKLSFLNHPRPLVTAMVLKNNPNDACFCIKNSIYDGADAFGIQLCQLKREFKTEACYRGIFAATGQRPIYITNYRSAENTGMTDEECMEGLVTALSCGATLGDVMGDVFDRGADKELTYDPKAVDKQRRLIDTIHEMGKEVLISSHVLRFITAEEVLEIAYQQRKRGADVVKIVTSSNSDEELMENLRITTLLKKELDCPFLYLSGGSHSKIHRMVGPQLGCVSYLAVHEHDAQAIPTQPTVRAAKAVRDNLDYLPDIVV